jgi:hypothetical protein
MTAMHTISTVTRVAALLAVLLAIPEQGRGTDQQASDTSDLAAQISQAFVFTQPIVWVGVIPPTSEENSDILKAVKLAQEGHLKEGISEFENFIAAHPGSPWTPSLRANLGKYYRHAGRYTPALEHWRAAWETMKKAEGGRGRQVADYTFAHWTR